MKKNMRLIIPIVFIIIIGSSFITNSKLENIRLVDIVQLVVIGIFIGLLIANLSAKFWKK